jgi:hypothetical protein
MLLGGSAATAAAAETMRKGGYARTPQSDRPGVPPAFSTAPLQNHGPLFGHLPPVQQNLEVVGKLEVDGEFGNVAPGQIADASVHKGHAYLNSWDVCGRGGTFVADIRDPSDPQEIGFIPATDGYYHGEGAHALSIDTPQFDGDLLAVNNEAYGASGANPDGDACRPDGVEVTNGGFELYNVSDPANPVPLSGLFGDQSPDDGTVEVDPAEGEPNSYHSVFVWQDGPKAYLAASDSTELHDVDIYDITDPEEPEFIKDLDVIEEFPQTFANDETRDGLPFHHDLVVKRVGNQMRMSVSYWDAGYVQLDVTNPAAPTYITDTDFSAPDQQLPDAGAPEGNAHQSEFSHDNEFLLGADEDFTTHRPETSITEAPFEGPFASTLADSEPIEGGTSVDGDTVYVGDACGVVAAPPADVTIAVTERGTCSFQIKLDNIQAAGYDAAVVFNNSFGAGGARCETLLGMQLNPDTVNIPAIFVGRTDGLKILNSFDENTYECTGAVAETPSDTDPPAVGALGLSISIASVFDGWGYARLFDANTSEELDSFAIVEATDDRYATDFGDLSIHEFATDPTENLAYSSYYSGGIRVLGFDREDGLQERGKWIDDQGSNFWGIEQYTTPQGERLIAGSDRDFGLVILRYTGPGAAVRPACNSRAVSTGVGAAVTIPLVCTDANGNPLQRRIASLPANGTLTALNGTQVQGDSVTYTPRAGFQGTDVFTFVANDGAADSAPAGVFLGVGTSPPPVQNPPVAPSNRFTLKLGKLRNGRLPVRVRVQARGKLAVDLKVPIRGRAVRLARLTRQIGKAGSVRVTLKLSRKARQRLAGALERSRSGRVRGRIGISFKPTGGTTRRTFRSITIRSG